MRTLVIPLSKLRLLRHQKAFTLIEIMVVLVLLGLVSSIVLPKLNTIYDNFMFRIQRDAVLQKISSLGYRAYNSQQNIKLSNNSAVKWLELPETILFDTPADIIYQPNGFCSGGRLSLIYQGLKADYQLPPPYCQPRLIRVD